VYENFSSRQYEETITRARGMHELSEKFPKSLRNGRTKFKKGLSALNDFRPKYSDNGFEFFVKTLLSEYTTIIIGREYITDHD